MNGTDRWADLAPRVGSAVLMVGVAAGAVWAGGVIFAVFVALICGAMVWELSRMLDPAADGAAVQMGMMTGAMVLASYWAPPMLVLPLLLAPAVAGASRVASGKGIYVLYVAAIALAGFSLVSVRLDLGVVWILWLFAVVVASDVAGYFAGKAIGGAKLWPRVSPKKTWSGTLAGWAGAALVGLVFAPYAQTGLVLVPVSVFMAMVAQAGDIAESAIKRRAGVKDSSALIPGHGGVMDRFDGMLGAAVFVLLCAAIFGFPAGLV